MSTKALALTRRDLLVIAGVASLLLVTHLLVPLWAGTIGADTVRILQYGSYLVVFSVWMAWFVTTGVRIWQEMETEP